MSDQNVLVSSGKCYTAAGKELDSSFIPCGNDAFGHQTCCGAGDNCLADGACFGEHGSGYGHMLTYWAGCTDPEYKASVCPRKQVDQPWVALTLCDDSGGAWAICSQEGDPKTLQPGSYCSCTDESKATVAFKDGDTLDNVAALPQNTGDTISFFQGHSPTATKPTPTGGGGGGGDGGGGESGGSSGNTAGGEATGGGGNGDGTSKSDPTPPISQADGPSATGRPTTERETSPSSVPATGTTFSESTGSPPLSTAKPTTLTSTGAAGSVTTVTTTAANTSSPTGGAGNNGSDSNASAADDGGLSSSAIIGIGVGVGVAAILLLAAVMLLLRRRRQRLRSPATTTSDTDVKKAAGPPPASPPSGPGLAGAGRYEADGRPMKEPGKLRSELAGGFGSGKRRKGGSGRGPSELHTDTGVGRHATAELPADTGVGRGGAAELPAHSARTRPSARDPLVPAPLQIRHHNEALPEAPLPAGAGLPPLQPQVGGLAHSAPDQPRVAPSVKPWGAQWRRP